LIKIRQIIHFDSYLAEAQWSIAAEAKRVMVVAAKE